MQTRKTDCLCFILKSYGSRLDVFCLGIKCQNSFISVTKGLGGIPDEMPYMPYKEELNC